MRALRYQIAPYGECDLRSIRLRFPLSDRQLKKKGAFHDPLFSTGKKLFKQLWKVLPQLLFT